MKKLLAITALTLVLALSFSACESKQADDDTAESAVSTQTLSTDPDTGVTYSTEPMGTIEPTDPEEKDEVADFMDEHFGDYGEEGEYEFKEEVGGKPVNEYGVVDEDGEAQIYTPGDPKAPTVHKPDPTPTEDPTEPDPTEDPTEPTDQPTEPDTGSDPEPDPVPPQNAYSDAISAIDDYTADVKYVCEVELSDGSVSKYVYKYRVSKAGDDYSAAYMDKGTEKTTVFSLTEGTMTTEGVSKAATLTDFYRFCSMVEPIPLSLYYYERSEAGTDVSARMNGEDYRALLLNTSPLFTGFDTLEGITMGSLYFNGHIDARGVYTASEAAFDMTLDDSILGLMLFRVSVEVDYVY